jgi:hypothetical protein
MSAKQRSLSGLLLRETRGPAGKRRFFGRAMRPKGYDKELVTEDKIAQERLDGPRAHANCRRLPSRNKSANKQ